MYHTQTNNDPGLSLKTLIMLLADCINSSLQQRLEIKATEAAPYTSQNSVSKEKQARTIDHDNLCTDILRSNKMHHVTLMVSCGCLKRYRVIRCLKKTSGQNKHFYY